jgi:protein OS-9
LEIACNKSREVSAVPNHSSFFAVPIPHGKMHTHISALLAVAPVAFASQNVFSVHDDLLAFPQVNTIPLSICAPLTKEQYDVIFSNALISDQAASSIVQQAASATHAPPQTSNTELESHNGANKQTGKDGDNHLFDPAHETYELMYLNGEQQLCTIPIVNIPPRNETSEAEAKLAEAKEIARATNKGWELLQGLEGNCLYYVSGWWSYAFCYNSEITQFHALPPQTGKPLLPPVRDTSTKEYVLGRAKRSYIKSEKSDATQDT